MIQPGASNALCPLISKSHRIIYVCFVEIISHDTNLLKSSIDWYFEIDLISIRLEIPVSEPLMVEEKQNIQQTAFNHSFFPELSS